MRALPPIRFLQHPIRTGTALLAGSLVLTLCLAGSQHASAQTATKHKHKRHAASTRSKPVPVPVVAPAQPVRPLTPAEMPPQPAHITYVEGKLTVDADNSDLNQILLQICHTTGTQLTGSSSDSRVFGKYGPATVSEVLTTLLDGTANNLLLVNGAGPAPKELILTPQTGSATTAAAYHPVPTFQQPEPPTNRADPSIADQEPQRPEFPPRPMQDNGNPQASPDSSGTNNTDQPSPNGIKTPQQIFEELQKLRQQAVPQTPPTD